jgi:hypothetical protein
MLRRAFRQGPAQRDLHGTSLINVGGFGLKTIPGG